MRAAWAVGCVVVWVAAGCTADPPAETAPAAGPVAATTNRAAVVGVAGCSARGCHGQLDATAGVTTAATAWGRWDKHGQAFKALRTPLAGNIIAHLGAGWQPATAEPRCLACHVTPRLAGGPSPLHADGVGCEACHTAPGRDTGEWLVAHWQAGGLKGSYDAGALRRLGDAKSRAEACVGCHVGAPAADGLPVREVTHDLIAAGHPRLNFDLLTFLELMPPHWAKERDREPKPMVWQAGQVETAKAALTLAASRAAGPGAWPELADRNCFACHHRLTDPGAAKPAWTSPLVSAPLANLLGWGEDERRLLATTDRTTAAAGWKRLCDRLSLAEPATPDRLVSAVRKGDARDWDAAAQGYYALRAAGRDVGLLQRLADKLRLPRSPDVVNSPVEYDPVAVGGLLAEAAAQ